MVNRPHRSPQSSSFFYVYADPQDLHSFPTRRSSDLARRHEPSSATPEVDRGPAPAINQPTSRPAEDRKSTRLNSSHSQISYAVFCLKKKQSAPGRSIKNLQASISVEMRLPFAPMLID